jgi:murein DD-endopeptidase MepM/ murein hydrolase activator NlpD
MLKNQWSPKKRGGISYKSTVVTPPPDLRLSYPENPRIYPITQLFGENPDLYPRTNGHEGIDWGVPMDTPVQAVLPWIAAAYREYGDYGRYVTLTHEGGYVSIYAHLLGCVNDLTATGEAGRVIGFSGSTGRSTGAHLHLTLLYRGHPFDPLPWFAAIRE